MEGECERGADRSSITSGARPAAQLRVRVPYHSVILTVLASHTPGVVRSARVHNAAAKVLHSSGGQSQKLTGEWVVELRGHHQPRGSVRFGGQVRDTGSGGISVRMVRASGSA
jgi:hypothetical protein